jgi:hypothetical protein
LNLTINPCLGCVRPTIYIYRSEYLGTKLYQRLVLKVRGYYMTLRQVLSVAWQCVIRHNNQCISAGNVLCGTTTSVFHLAMCHTVPQSVYFTWQCVIRYHCQPLYFTWQCVIRYHNQCNLAICHTIPQPAYFTWQCVMRYHDQYNLAICHTIPQPAYFTW